MLLIQSSVFDLLYIMIVPFWHCSRVMLCILTFFFSNLPNKRLKFQQSVLPIDLKMTNSIPTKWQLKWNQRHSLSNNYVLGHGMDPISVKQLFTHKRSEGSKRDRQGKKSEALWACSLRGVSFSYSFLWLGLVQKLKSFIFVSEICTKYIVKSQCSNKHERVKGVNVKTSWMGNGSRSEKGTLLCEAEKSKSHNQTWLTIAGCETVIISYQKSYIKKYTYTYKIFEMSLSVTKDTFINNTQKN